MGWRVPVWQRVTVALAPGALADSSTASGRPTSRPRPTITTWEPSTWTFSRRSSSTMPTAVHGRIGIELGHGIQDLPLGRGRWQRDLARVDPPSRSRPLLGADIDVGGLVVADQHRRKARPRPHAGQPLDLVGQLLLDLRRHRPAVQRPRRHPSPSCRASRAINATATWPGGARYRTQRHDAAKAGAALPGGARSRRRQAGARRDRAGPGRAVLRDQPGAVLGGDRPPLRQARQPLLAGAAPLRVHATAAGPRRAGPPAGAG